MRLQLTYLIIAAFFGLAAYPFTRTSAAPFFNAAYGPENLVWAMIASAALAVIVVIIYNRLAKRFSLIPLCIGAMTFVILVTAVFGLAMGNHPRWLAIIYYAWSDVYILILVEQFWSISNTLFMKRDAKRYYGIFLTSGAIGSLFGNFLVTKLAEPLGAENLIFLCPVFLSLFVMAVYLLNRSVSANESIKHRFDIEHNIADRSSFGGASLVFNSRYLFLIALLIVATQIYINGSYFIYNRFLNSYAGAVDTQSSIYGRVFLIIEIATITTNVIIVPLALRFLGVGRTHYSIVGIILFIFALTIISPHMAFVAALFIAAKSFDYSIFRAAKEMFYLPLHVAEKFQAKAFIDVFVYRFSKAIAAAGIIFVGRILHINLFYLVGFGIVAWLVLIILILRIYHTIASPD